jgi:hypothetical protein
VSGVAIVPLRVARGSLVIVVAVACRGVAHGDGLEAAVAGWHRMRRPVRVVAVLTDAVMVRSVALLRVARVVT